MDITTYVLVNTDDEYVGEEMDTLDEARNAASQEDEPHAIVEITYTFEDSALVWTPDGSDTWPPRQRRIIGHQTPAGFGCGWSLVTVTAGYSETRCPNDCPTSAIEEI
jgi:hypothetical protein